MHGFMVNIAVCAVTCLVMILSVLFFPKIRMGKLKIDSYWVVVLFGTAILLLCGQTDVKAIGKALVANTAVNPLKILILFISMTVLSVFLDELGFFRAVAGWTLRHAHSGQKRLFFSLYCMVAVLTVFTSNDIIVLSFTPFICYFAREAKIDPIPYLATEFVAANTWSMALVIGNPTNIYLATAFGIGFFSYFLTMILPTLAAGGVSLLCLYLLFRKKLSEPILGHAERDTVEDRPALVIGLVHLGVCTILLAVSSYIGAEMWLIALCSAGSLFLSNLVLALVRRKKPRVLLGCVKRAPWQLIPFLLSMFIMTEALAMQGTTAKLGSLLGTGYHVPIYGALAFAASNLINNIPMSVFFSSMIAASDAGLGAVYATVIGSNLGAFFTPIGALAGLMFGSILAEHDVKFGYKSFLKLGVCVAIPSLISSLGVLWLLI